MTDYVPMTAEQLLTLIKARDLLLSKGEEPAALKVVDVMRRSVLQVDSEGGI